MRRNKNSTASVDVGNLFFLYRFTEIVHYLSIFPLIHTLFSFISEDIFTVKRRLRDYRREMDHKTTVNIEPGLRGRSGRVVVTAIVM